ncbi:MAG TPA: hypothetical protein V6D21_11395 [Candidatus Obscuribacterales bacterium]
MKNNENNEVIEIDDSKDEILDSLILVPQFTTEIEPEIEFLNDQTCYWLWGQVDTGDYLDIVNDTVGDVQRHLAQFERAIKCQI